MTISTQLSKASFAGNGVSAAFPLPFPFLREADIQALLFADGVETGLRLGTHFTLSGAGAAGGGALSMRTPPATGQTLVVWRAPAIVQEVDYVENSAFPAETHEAALDLLTMICQGLQEQLDRSIKVSMASDLAPEDYLGAVQGARSQAVASAAAAEAAREAASAGLASCQAVCAAAESASASSAASAQASASLATVKAEGMDAVRVAAEAARDAAAASATGAAEDRAQTGLDRAAVASDTAQVAADKATSSGYKDAAAASATAAAASAASAGASAASAAASASAAAASAASLTPSAQARAIGGEAYNRLLGIACPPSLERKAWDAKGLTNGIPTGFAFARASAATYFDATGKLASAASGVLRHDFEPFTGAYRGMLLEGQGTNLLYPSEQFDNAAWTKLGASVSANGSVAPDGNTSMDALIEDTSNGWHMTYQVFTPTAGTAYTYSVFAKKKGGGRCFQMQFSGGGIAAQTLVLNLDTGAILATPAAGGYSVQQVSADTYRVSVTLTTLDTTTLSLFLFLHNGSAISYTGDGASGVFLWGAQLEAGSHPTSYIPTTSAQATRAEESLSIATSAFPFNAAEGTLFCEASRVSIAHPGYYPFIVSLDDGNTSGNNTIQVYATPNGETLYGYNSTSGIVQANMSIGSGITAGVLARLALAYKANDMAGCVNGGSIGADSSCSLPALTRLILSCWQPGTGVYIRYAAYFPRRLSNAELQNLTK